MAPRNLVILGSTGSIGRQALEVVRRYPDRLRVVGLAARQDVHRLKEQIGQFCPQAVCVVNETAAKALEKTATEAGAALLVGAEGLEQLAAWEAADMVLVALSGCAGLRPTLSAIGAGKDIALANKETLVAGGALVSKAAKQRGVRLLPVDSEHSALFQILEGKDPASVRRLVLTASGGPFARSDLEQMATASVEAALAHPTWNMGKKVTIDSATLMNKGLEVVEAHWLFAMPKERIDVLIHHQSIVHGIVEFVDGSVMAHMGVPDMRHPIQHALLYPERLDGLVQRLDIVSAFSQLTFEPPDLERFPCLRMAYEALEAGGTMPAVLNAANEVAVQRFLEDRLDFLSIPRVVEQTMGAHRVIDQPEISQVLAADLWARKKATELCG